jgi:hypothetical protein
MFVQMPYNVFVYGKLRVSGRGFSEGKSEAGKQATNFVLAKTSNFLYTVLCYVFYSAFINSVPFHNSTLNSTILWKFISFVSSSIKPEFIIIIRLSFLNSEPNAEK